MKTILSLFFLLFTSTLFAQVAKEEFTIVKEIKHLPVISQGSTGTCWSFTTTSFLESEIMRNGYPETDLSEMFFVYHGYLNKAKQYLFYQGNNNFGQGGQAHDVIDVLRVEGMVTNETYEGEKVDGKYQHRELVKELKDRVDTLNKAGKDFSVDNLDSFESILKKHIGKIPGKIKTEDGKLTPAELVNQYNLNPDDYVEITSYSHHPYYKPFVLEVPDNWAHALYYNVPVDELIEIMYNAIHTGYTIAWDGDTSEKTFMHKKGNATVPENQQGKVTQELRQETFMNRTTTDDHLMHIVGLSKDSSGNNCFYTKNSWGQTSNEYGGYLHMTEDYVRLKTIAIMVHKAAIPQNIKDKLKL